MSWSAPWWHLCLIKYWCGFVPVVNWSVLGIPFGRRITIIISIIMHYYFLFILFILSFINLLMIIWSRGIKQKCPFQQHFIIFLQAQFCPNLSKNKTEAKYCSISSCYTTVHKRTKTLDSSIVHTILKTRSQFVFIHNSSSSARIQTSFHK